LFGGTPLHISKPEYVNKHIDQGPQQDSTSFMNDDQALDKLLGVRSFKEIQSILNQKKTR